MTTTHSTPLTDSTGTADAVTPEAAFGIRLRRAREQQGVSLRQMARRLTRSHSNLWDYERGHRLATPEVVSEYERELGLPGGELLVPLEEARRQVYGLGRDRRRPFRPPAEPRRVPSAPRPERGRDPVRSGPFVGRETEMATVLSWMGEAWSGDPRIILLRGDAGIGKSALVSHALARARGAGWTTLSGSCLQGARIAYLPIATALGPLSKIREASAALLDLFLVGDGQGTAESDAAADRRHLQLFVATTQALLDAADEQPLMLVVEDLHWADDSTLGLLEHLASVATQRATLSPVSLVVLVTFRRDHEDQGVSRLAPRLRREATCRDLELTGLDELGVTQIVAELGRARPSPPLVRSLAGASRGNPLLLNILFERLMADGAIDVGDGELAGRRLRLPTVGIELDVELSARVDRVDSVCRELLIWAAMLGDGQPVATLHAVTGSTDADFDRAMQAAADARVLYEAGDQYRFDHPQLREVLYEKLPERQRRRKHLVIADVLDALRTGDGDTPGRPVGTNSRNPGEGASNAAVVAHHLHEAGAEASPEKLFQNARVAAEQSFALAAWSDAAAYYEMCLRADPAAEGDAELLWRAGLSHFRNHDHRQAEDRLVRALDVARRSGDERGWGRAALALTKSRVTGGSLLGADIDLTPLEEFLRQSGDATADLKARAQSLISDACFARFDFPRGFEAAHQALRCAEGLADHEVTAEVELALGIQYLAALQLDEAECHLENCGRSATQLRDPWARAWAPSRLPLIDWCRGDLARADARGAQAAGLASEHFDWAECSLALATRVAVAAAQGRIADAERLGALAHQQYLRSDYLWTVLVLAPALTAGRAFIGAAETAQEAIATIGSTGVDPGAFDLAARAVMGDEDGVSGRLATYRFAPPSGPSYSLFDLAFAALHTEACEVTNDTDLARAALAPLEAAHAAGFVYTIGWVASTARLLGIVYRCLGRHADAERSLQHAIAGAEAAPVERARAQMNLAHLYFARGDKRAAAEAAKPARRTFRELGLQGLSTGADRMGLAAAGAGS
jgi:transcriptional regulator with XRE-family HTH domain/tetratricopeptide (TPR) repeat protein